jgi:pimeloyl-ACP methyl ester carboxylesterase
LTLSHIKERDNYLENLRKYGSAPFRVAVIHGGPGAAGELEPVARRLGEKRGVLEPLQTAKSLDGQVEELREILEQKGEIPVILIGHSWGAWLSYIVAARYPSIIKKLILIGSGPFEEKYFKDITENRFKRLTTNERDEYKLIISLLDNLGTNGKDVSLTRLGELAAKADSYEPVVATPKRTLALNLAVSPGEIYAGVWPEVANLRKTGQLLALAAQIKCPVLAIHGDCDPSPPEGIEQPLSAALKNFGFILLEKCGHDPWREKYAAEKFYEILENELPVE